jgi:hypothetical protein
MYFKELQKFLDERIDRSGVSGKTTLERRVEIEGDFHSPG